MRNLLERDNGTELSGLVRTRDQAARDELATILRAAESTVVARDWATASRMLNPVGVYRRLFDCKRSQLSLVLPDTRRGKASMLAMESTSRLRGRADTASSVVLAQLCSAVRNRMSGPSDRRLRVLLRADIHYLHALSDQKVYDSRAGPKADQVQRAFQAIRTNVLSSPDVFSAAQLVQFSENEPMHLLREQRPLRRPPRRPPWRPRPTGQMSACTRPIPGRPMATAPTIIP